MQHQHDWILAHGCSLDHSAHFAQPLRRVSPPRRNYCRKIVYKESLTIVLDKRSLAFLAWLHLKILCFNIISKMINSPVSISYDPHFSLYVLVGLSELLNFLYKLLWGKVIMALLLQPTYHMVQPVQVLHHLPGQ